MHVFEKNIKDLDLNIPDLAQPVANYVPYKIFDMINVDTYDKKNNFFSARRSLRSNNDDYGRNISIIMIN